MVPVLFLPILNLTSPNMDFVESVLSEIVLSTFSIVMVPVLPSQLTVVTSILPNESLVSTLVTVSDIWNKPSIVTTLVSVPLNTVSTLAMISGYSSLSPRSASSYTYISSFVPRV